MFTCLGGKGGKRGCWARDPEHGAGKGRLQVGGLFILKYCIHVCFTVGLKYILSSAG